MHDFKGKIAVITGGGTGMGRDLCVQLAREGCHIAMCDVSGESMQETKEICEAESPHEITVSTSICDVSDESQVITFSEEVKKIHRTEHINLLFNNAGIGGGGSFIVDDRVSWDKTFGVCWFGVYYCSRAFLPMLIASDEGHIVNTSSVNGFFATVGPSLAHTAYSTAKFAVKGFSEALINDLRLHAPHVNISLVMPGHIGTSLVSNSGKVLGMPDVGQMSDEDIRNLRQMMMDMGDNELANLSDDQLKEALQKPDKDFRDNAPMTSSEAATIILDGVRAKKWRLLVGEDAHKLDKKVRQDPENAYERSFFQELLDDNVLNALSAAVGAGIEQDKS
ncbi:MAG: short-chain dehydrogenase [Gammaproteobacteria bacterium]|jgi:NAD(P)-dependent dehydrogenase (short-subunit alcohol dehydrogenase family)|nr:short-chain dehydrogenase [Gammaproteobacteria bacterium]|tara:strand:+ start:1308 stop:2315 length:1008 start_codon:yes stop_codon:yes gene_type:complete